MSAPVVTLIAHDLQFHEHLPRVFPHEPNARNMFEGDANRDFRSTFAFRNGSLQGAYFMLAARAVGLDVGPMSGFDNARVSVTDGDNTNSATHINQLVAVHVLHDRAVGVVNKDWQGGANAGSNYLLATFLHLGGKWTWNCGYEDSLLLKAHVSYSNFSQGLRALIYTELRASSKLLECAE
jgi:hypothetical protein